MRKRRAGRRSKFEVLESRYMMAIESLGDINTTYGYQEGPEESYLYTGERPGAAVTVGDVTYYINSDSRYGVELWRTDGTAEGTHVIRDIAPGVAAGVSEHSLLTFNGKIYFLATDGSGERIWTTDGTAAGTHTISDYVFASDRLNRYTKTAVGRNGFYISRFDTPIVFSDGTSTGTKLLTVAGTSDWLGDPLNMYAHGGQVFFDAQRNGGGYQMWVADGDTANPLTADGEGIFERVSIRQDDGRMLFATAGGAPGYQTIWKWDQQQNTAVKLLVADGQRFSQFRVIGDTLYAIRTLTDNTTEVWAVDLETRSPVLIKSFASRQVEGIERSVATQIKIVKVNGQAMLHVASLGTSDQLWNTDGTAAGTTLATTLPFGSVYLAWPEAIPQYIGYVSHPYPRQFIEAIEEGGRLYLGLNGVTNIRWQLWVTDGTTAGTIKLGEDLLASPSSTAPYGIGGSQLNASLFGWASSGNYQFEVWTGSAGKVYFSADVEGFGIEPWVTDGTVAGTKMLADMNQQRYSSGPQFFVGRDHDVLFTIAAVGADGVPNGGRVLARTDGTSTGTSAVASLSPSNIGSKARKFVQLGDRIYFIGDTGQYTDNFLIVYDPVGGTASRVVLNSYTMSVRGDEELIRVADRIYFVNDNGGRNLMQIGAAGTVSKVDLTALGHEGFRDIRALVDFKGQLVFATCSDDYIWELWKTNGEEFERITSTEGLPKIYNLPYAAFVQNGALFVQDPLSELSAWSRYDSVRKSLIPLPSAPQTAASITYGGYTYYVADGIGSREIWRTNGTTSQQLTSINADPAELTLVGDRLFFTANDGIYGRELWQMDLRTRMASLVEDLLPGPAGSDPVNLTAIEHTLLFSATDGVHGSEPWRWSADDAFSPASETLAYHNILHAGDVNDDGHVTPLDALLIIIALNSQGARALPESRTSSDKTPLVDTNADGILSALDVMYVLMDLQSDEE
jgi:ELWxxDGT repeat protein